MKEREDVEIDVYTFFIRLAAWNTKIYRSKRVFTIR